MIKPTNLTNILFVSVIALFVYIFAGKTSSLSKRIDVERAEYMTKIESLRSELSATNQKLSEISAFSIELLKEIDSINILLNAKISQRVEKTREIKEKIVRYQDMRDSLFLEECKMYEYAW